MPAGFRDRVEAGQVLAGKLLKYKDRSDVLVLALPRGGVPVAFEVAKALHAPLDVFLVRKLGAPGHEELGVGALASGGVRVVNTELMESLNISERSLEEITSREWEELQRREHAYRDDRPPSDVTGKIVILVDDGLATGASMRAAAMALQERHPKKIVIAVPVAAVHSCDEFRDKVDEIVCAETPEPFYSVGSWYDNFSQTTDDEVRHLLAAASNAHIAPAEPRP
ncbi:MAG: phosphoribosyltransferase [Bryobacteraceae bacterium]